MIKNIIFGLGALGMVAFAQASMAHSKNHESKRAVVIEITPKHVKGVKITKVEGGTAMKGFTVKRSQIDARKAHIRLEQLKERLEPGETVNLAVGVTANGKAEVCNLKLTMGEKHQFSDVKVEGCETFEGAEVRSHGKKAIIILTNKEKAEHKEKTEHKETAE